MITKPQPKSEAWLRERFDHTHNTFQAKIMNIAHIAGEEPMQVYMYWRKYSQDCNWMDQSPLLIEFVEWYKDLLGGDIRALQAAT